VSYKNALLLLLLFVSITISSTLSAKVIMVFGDSLSAAYGMKVDDGWVKLLERKFEEDGASHKITNASISGNTSGNGLGRIEIDLELHQPDILILELGGNDGLRGHSPKLFKANMEKIIQQALAKNIDVLLLAIKLPPSYGRRYGKAFDGVYIDLAESYPVTLLPFFMDKVAGNKELMQADGIHPNEKGQPLLLDNVWGYLEKML
jgi:acyl-CoA thioesterase-1